MADFSQVGSALPADGMRPGAHPYSSWASRSRQAIRTAWSLCSVAEDAPRLWMSLDRSFNRP